MPFYDAARRSFEKIVPAAVGGAATLLLMKYVYSGRTAPLSVGIELLTCFFLSTLLHEAGHAAGAALGGFRLVSFACWFFELYRVEDRWKVRRMASAVPSGFVRAAPIGAARLQSRYALLVAAGPAASLLAAAVFLALPPPHVRWLAEDLAALGWCSALAGLMTLVPFTSSGGRQSDGARLAAVVGRGVDGQRICAILALQSSTLAGVRPKLWDPDLLRIASDTGGDSADATVGRMLLYNHQFDGRDYARAWTTLLWVLDRPLEPLTRAIWRLEAAWFQSFVRRDAAAAVPWLDPELATAESAYTCALWKTKAALACAGGRWSEAEATIERGLEACERLDDAGCAVAVRESLLQLRHEVEGRQRA